MNDPKLGIELIKKWEGLHLDAYLDPIGIPTIGWGTTVYPNGEPVSMGNSINYAQAEDFLYFDVKTKREPAIKRLVHVELNNYQYGALVSFVYNIGVGAFERSTMLRKINEKDFDGAAKEFDRWVKAGGKTLKGLVNRRRDERALFERNEWPVTQSDKDTSVVDEAIDTIDNMDNYPEWIRHLIAIINSIIDYLFKPKEKKDLPLLDLILENTPDIGLKMTRMAVPWFEDARVKNNDYMFLVDFDLHDSRKRGYLVDLKTGKSDRFEVAHGKKSDPDRDGRPDLFSNVSGSNKSSLGAMLLTEQYGKSVGGWSKFRYALKIIGLQSGINDRVFERAIVFHEANYVTDKLNDHTGDSLGCFAVSPSVAKRIINKIDDGCLLFAYHKSLDK